MRNDSCLKSAKNLNGYKSSQVNSWSSNDQYTDREDGADNLILLMRT